MPILSVVNVFGKPRLVQRCKLLVEQSLCPMGRLIDREGFFETSNRDVISHLLLLHSLCIDKHQERESKRENKGQVTVYG